MWDASDEALVAGLGAGDRDAALVFIRRFQSRVLGLALSIVRDAPAAEEVAQDTFVRAWRYSASYDPRRGSAAAWLLAIARNVALDYVRALGRRRDQPALDPLDVALFRRPAPPLAAFRLLERAQGTSFVGAPDERRT